MVSGRLLAFRKRNLWPTGTHLFAAVFRSQSDSILRGLSQRSIFILSRAIQNTLPVLYFKLFLKCTPKPCSSMDDSATNDVLKAVAQQLEAVGPDADESILRAAFEQVSPTTLLHPDANHHAQVASAGSGEWSYHHGGVESIPEANERACAHCGDSGPQLLRCSRCKQVWSTCEQLVTTIEWRGTGTVRRSVKKLGGNSTKMIVSSRLTTAR